VVDPSLAERIVAAWKSWSEAQTLAALLPEERAKEALRHAVDEERGLRGLEGRVRRAVDAAVRRLRGEARSARELIGAAAVERLIDAAGALEPDERAIRAFFEERAAHDLLGSVLYDGIVEFMKKANQATEALPGITTAKKLAGGVGGFLGSLGGGLAGAIAGGVREELERRLEEQVRQFLAGFGKVAVDRAVRFATSPQNRAAFRDMRKNLARRILTTPVRELASGITDAQAEDLARRLVEGTRAAAEDERATRRLEGRIEAFARERGGETLAAALARSGGEPLPTEPVARLLAPALARFLETDEARRLLTAALQETQAKP
jgi:O-acetyl-ADP-ribose deacetylase (regulator of RNase III)